MGFEVFVEILEVFGQILEVLGQIFEAFAQILQVFVEILEASQLSLEVFVKILHVFVQFVLEVSEVLQVRWLVLQQKRPVDQILEPTFQRNLSHLWSKTFRPKTRIKFESIRLRLSGNIR